MKKEKFENACILQRRMLGDLQIAKHCDYEINHLRDAPNFAYLRSRIETLMSYGYGNDMAEIFREGAICYLQAKKREANKRAKQMQKEFNAL